MPIFLRILHTCASVDAEITGAGHETMHQHCALGILGKTWTSGDHAPAWCLKVNGEYLCQRGDFRASRLSPWMILFPLLVSSSVCVPLSKP